MSGKKGGEMSMTGDSAYIVTAKGNLCEADIAKFAARVMKRDPHLSMGVAVVEGKTRLLATHIQVLFDLPDADIIGKVVRIWVSDGKCANCVWPSPRMLREEQR